jgi:hypothetical protein
MKTLARIIMFILATNYVTASLKESPRTRIGRRSNYDPLTFRIPNNGGL